MQRLWRSRREGQARPDDAWALARLNPAEWAVYRSLDARDREHAVRVARALAAEQAPSPELLAAALLHDCGKRERPYRLAERVGLGLLPRALCARLPGRAAYLRAHHDAEGERLLRHAGARPRVCELVARSHDPGSDPEAQLLAAYDGRE